MESVVRRGSRAADGRRRTEGRRRKGTPSSVRRTVASSQPARWCANLWRRPAKTMPCHLAELLWLGLLRLLSVLFGRETLKLSDRFAHMSPAAQDLKRTLTCHSIKTTLNIWVNVKYSAVCFQLDVIWTLHADSRQWQIHKLKYLLVKASLCYLYLAPETFYTLS